MDALAAAAARRRGEKTPTPSSSSSSSSSPASSKRSALSIQFLIDEDTSDDPSQAHPDGHADEVADEQPRGQPYYKRARLGDSDIKLEQRQHLEEVDDDEDRLPPTTTSTQRQSPFEHLLNPSKTATSASSSPSISNTTTVIPSHHHQHHSALPSSGLANPPVVLPSIVLPQPVRPPRHFAPGPSPPSSTGSLGVALAHPVSAFTTSQQPQSTTSSVEPPRPTPALPAAQQLPMPPSAALLDLQFLSQLYLLGGLLPGTASTTTTTTTQASTSAAAAAAGQLNPAHPAFGHLQQHMLHQAFALAQFQPHHHQQVVFPNVVGISTSVPSGTTGQPQPMPVLATAARDHHHSHHHHHPQHNLYRPAVGGDRHSALEAILSRAEQQAFEDQARQSMRSSGGVKRERGESAFGTSDRAQRRRRIDSDGDHSPYRGQPQSEDDSSFASSSSSSDDDDSTGGKKRGSTVGTGMKEMLYKRRQASPKQVVLLEQIFAVEPIPTSATKLRLSEVLNMSPKRVTVWFKNKRARQKKKGIPLPNSAASTSTSSNSPAAAQRSSPLDRKPVPTTSSPPLASPARPHRRDPSELTFHYFDDNTDATHHHA